MTGSYLRREVPAFLRSRLETPPQDLDELVVWFEHVSHGLVLLEEYTFDEVRAAVDAMRRGIEGHLDGASSWIARGERAAYDRGRIQVVLDEDHRWFRESLDQLDWFWGVVRAEDHGGHRQALGQYGRILAESFRRHRALESAFQE